MGVSGFTHSYEAFVSMAIPDGVATGVYACPGGPWLDSEGFLDAELKGIGDYLNRRHGAICSQILDK